MEPVMADDPREPFMRKGHWPCQQVPRRDLPPRLVALMYRLLRDGAHGPGAVEEHLLNVGAHDEDPDYTNVHLELLARAHVTFMLDRWTPGDQEQAYSERLEAIRDAVNELQRMMEAAEEEQAEHEAEAPVTPGDTTARVDVDRLVGIVNAIDLILSGDPGCVEPEEVPWAGKRKF